MRDLRPGLAIRTVDEFRLGRVTAVNDCCLHVQGDPGELFIRRDAVFTVTDYSVQLVCSREQAGRYSCSEHASHH